MHEYGHHFGLSHPHDGYDWEKARGFAGSGKTYFAWAGDESATVMSYLNTNDFSQFNRDSMDRWLAAGYLEDARAIALKVRDAGGSDAELDAIEAIADASIRLFADHDYFGSLKAASRATPSSTSRLVSNSPRQTAFPSS